MIKIIKECRGVVLISNIIVDLDIFDLISFERAQLII